jgi:HipA-like protein
VGGPPATATRPATIRATRYVTPLREGGSLPALMEADDDGLYVVKFRGAGQGPKALIAELLAGELARRLGLPVPELALVELDPVLGLAEPDPEIQDLISASAGLNLGVDFLPGALPFEPATGFPLDPALAAQVVWFDALLTNVDRTPRNPNLLVWHERLWLIDHGAALHVHHQTWDMASYAHRPFPPIRDHVLLPCAGSILDADEALADVADRSLLEELTDLVPEEWLGEHADERRAAYVDYLSLRLEGPREFAQEAERARLAAAG